MVGEGVTGPRAGVRAGPSSPRGRGQPNTGVLPPPPVPHPAHALRPSVPTWGRNTATSGGTFGTAARSLKAPPVLSHSIWPNFTFPLASTLRSWSRFPRAFPVYTSRREPLSPHSKPQPLRADSFGKGDSPQSPSLCPSAGPQHPGGRVGGRWGGGSEEPGAAVGSVAWGRQRGGKTGPVLPTQRSAGAGQGIAARCSGCRPPQDRLVQGYGHFGGTGGVLPALALRQQRWEPPEGLRWVSPIGPDPALSPTAAAERQRERD